MEHKVAEVKEFEKPQVDNPWLLWFVPLFLTVIGSAAGWIFGPIFFTPNPDTNPDLDVYSRSNFNGSFLGCATGLAAGLIIGFGVSVMLRIFPKKDATQLPTGPDHH